jgi:hypothetical protein
VTAADFILSEEFRKQLFTHSNKGTAVARDLLFPRMIYSFSEHGLCAVTGMRRFRRPTRMRRTAFYVIIIDDWEWERPDVRNIHILHCRFRHSAVAPKCNNPLNNNK